MQAANLVAFVGDMTQQEEIDRLFAYPAKHQGHDDAGGGRKERESGDGNEADERYENGRHRPAVDVFIANAGFAYYEHLQQADWQHIDRIYKLNTVSPIYCALKMRKLHQCRMNQPYKVVITSPAMTHWSVPGYALYSATKAALDSFARVGQDGDCRSRHGEKLDLNPASNPGYGGQRAPSTLIMIDLPNKLSRVFLLAELAGRIDRKLREY